MKFHALVRTAAGALVGALVAGGAFAQAATQPLPTTMTDTAPLPATDRTSSGAVILMNEPVLAQRQAMLAAQARSDVDTRSMGAGPANAVRRARTAEELRMQRALDELAKERRLPVLG